MNNIRKYPRPARYLAVLVLALGIGIPAAVAHTGAFTDVPHGSTTEGSILHQSANAMKGAGITAGCGATTYCPNDPVTRGQMAIFLKRGLGSVDRESDIGSLPFDEEPAILSSVDVNVPAGMQFVKIDAKVEIAASQACDCDVTLHLFDESGDFVSDGSLYQFNQSSVTTQTMTESWVFESEGGPHEFFLYVVATDNDAQTTAEFNSDWVRMIATTYPFGSMEAGAFAAPGGGTSSRVDQAQLQEAVRRYK